MRARTRKQAVDAVGRCIRCRGDVVARSGGGSRGTLTAGASIRAGNVVGIGGDGQAAFKFTDGTRVYLGENSELAVETYSDGGGADLALIRGRLLLTPGRLGAAMDMLRIRIGALELSVRGAAIAGRTDVDGFDLVTVLENDTGVTGEVYVDGTSGTVVLARPYQTLRCCVDGNYAGPPMVLPPAVFADIYAGPGMDERLMSRDGDEADSMVGAATFEPFGKPDERLFPEDAPWRDGRAKDLLEDAFDGKRFRLLQNAVR